MVLGDTSTGGKVLYNVLCSWRGKYAVKILLFLCNKLPQVRVGRWYVATSRIAARRSGSDCSQSKIDKYTHNL